MSYTITKKVKNMTRKTSDGTICSVWSRMYYNNDTGVEIRRDWEFDIAPPPAEGYTFIPFEDLTSDIVIGWIDAAYPEKLNELESEMVIEAGPDYDTSTGLPW